MRRAINMRLEESIIYTLNQLSDELNTTKTEIVEKAIKLLSKQTKIEKNNLLKYAGSLKESDADDILSSIKESKNIKDIEFHL